MELESDSLPGVKVVLVLEYATADCVADVQKHVNICGAQEYQTKIFKECM